MKKFDIYRVNLNPKKGHAQAGIRPCLVIQSNAINPYSTTVLMIPLTSNVKKKFIGDFIIKPSEKNGLSTESRVLMTQITAVDKTFISEKLGSLEPQYFEAFHESLSIALDLENIFLDD